MLEDEHEHAVRGADREQVEHDRLQRHDDRAEREEAAARTRTRARSAITYGMPCFIWRVKSTSSARVARDRRLDAGDAAERLRDRARRGEPRSRCRLAALSPAPVSGSSSEPAVPSALPLSGERRVRDAARDGQRLEPLHRCAARAAAASAGPGDDDDRGRRRARELGADAASVASAGSLCDASDSSLGFATWSHSAGSASATSTAGREAHESDGPAQHAVDHRRPEARLGRLGAQVRQERDPAAVDPSARAARARRAAPSPSPTTAQAIDGDRAARDPVEDVGADHVHAGHRDRDGRARDERRCGPTCAPCARAPRARRARGAAPRASGST